VAAAGSPRAAVAMGAVAIAGTIRLIQIGGVEKLLIDN